MLVGVALNALSRRHEFAADRFAAATTGRAEPLVGALKKQSLATLGNLTPHPFYVLWNDTHPPLLARVAHLRDTQTRGPDGAT